jgi:hypothetical protein
VYLKVPNGCDIISQNFVELLNRSNIIHTTRNLAGGTTIYQEGPSESNPIKNPFREFEFKLTGHSLKLAAPLTINDNDDDLRDLKNVQI